MRLVILESPFAGATEAEHERNLLYLDLCIRDSILRGESPFASHRLYPGALRDDDPAERDLGIRLGYEWWRAASLVAFYVDLGWSAGMLRANERSLTFGIKREVRHVK